MKRVLINAANLHVGGGVQVAASFIWELAFIRNPLVEAELTIYASSEVNENLVAAGFEHEMFHDYQVLDVFYLEALKPKVSSRFRGFDLIFTIFGPLYLPFSPPKHVVGFAQAWIIYPDNESAQRLRVRSRLSLSTKFLLQWFFFRTADRLVVELEHVKTGLTTSKSFPIDRIDVVHNCVSSIYFDPVRWMPLPAVEDLNDGVIKLGIVTRDYPHKNLDFLPQVAIELERISSKKYRFFVTLNDIEWSKRDLLFQEYVTNVGAIDIAQCPAFYKAMDAVFFPSLLECFSVTPLEAMVMQRPLFASNRRFVWDCCAEHAIYFEPIDPLEAAQQVFSWFEGSDSTVRKQHVERAYHHVLSLPGSYDRASAYIEIIKKQLFS